MIEVKLQVQGRRNENTELSYLRISDAFHTTKYSVEEHNRHTDNDTNVNVYF